MTVVESPFPGDDEFEKEYREAEWLISDPSFDEVSCVDSGDNPPAHIVLWKGAADAAENGHGGRAVSMSPTAQEPTDADLREIAELTKSWQREYHEQEIQKMDSRTQTTEGLDALADQIAKAHPEMTPADAYREAMASSEGRSIRKRYEDLPPEQVQPEPGRGQHTPSPEVARTQQRAAEIRKDAALQGSPISDAEAYKQAMLQR